MSLPLAHENQDARRALADNAAKQAVEVWRAGINPSDIRGSFALILPDLVRIVARAQLAAAFLVNPFLARTLGASPAAEILPASFSGAASDGRPLDTMLARVAVRALSLISGGWIVSRALTSAATLLQLMVTTQAQDAGRTAELTGMFSRGVMYTRVVRLPACARCIILAGTTYSSSEGFARHPGCDCAVLPLRSGEHDEALSPTQLFNSMTAEEQRKRFGEAGAEAIRSGAEMDQVVNARRGMTKAGTTPEGTTVRGWAGNRMGNFSAGRNGQRYRSSRTARLMPEEIFKRAKGDREAALAMLREHAYIR